MILPAPVLDPDQMRSGRPSLWSHIREIDEMQFQSRVGRGQFPAGSRSARNDPNNLGLACTRMPMSIGPSRDARHEVSPHRQLDDDFGRVTDFRSAQCDGRTRRRLGGVERGQKRLHLGGRSGLGQPEDDDDMPAAILLDAESGPPCHDGVGRRKRAHPNGSEELRPYFGDALSFRPAAPSSGGGESSHGGEPRASEIEECRGHLDRNLVVD